MYCPTCGLEHNEARRFCSRCGTNLEVIVRTLNGEFPDPTAAEKLEKRQRALRRGFLVFCSGPLFGISVVIVSEILRSLLGQTSPWGYGDPTVVQALQNIGLFGIVLSLIGLMMLVNAFIAYGRKRTLLQQALQPPQPLVNPPTRAETHKLQPASVTPRLEPPSVTENTTVHLEPGSDSPLRVDASPTEADQPIHRPTRQGQSGR